MHHDHDSMPDAVLSRTQTKRCLADIPATCLRRDKDREFQGHFFQPGGGMSASRARRVPASFHGISFASFRPKLKVGDTDFSLRRAAAALTIGFAPCFPAAFFHPVPFPSSPDPRTPLPPWWISGRDLCCAASAMLCSHHTHLRATQWGGSQSEEEEREKRRGRGAREKGTSKRGNGADGSGGGTSMRRSWLCFSEARACSRSARGLCHIRCT